MRRIVRNDADVALSYSGGVEPAHGLERILVAVEHCGDSSLHGAFPRFV
jgi:hypothetical protein